MLNLTSFVRCVWEQACVSTSCNVFQLHRRCTVFTLPWSSLDTVYFPGMQHAYAPKWKPARSTSAPCSTSTFDATCDLAAPLLPARPLIGRLPAPLLLFALSLTRSAPRSTGEDEQRRASIVCSQVAGGDGPLSAAWLWEQPRAGAPLTWLPAPFMWPPALNRLVIGTNAVAFCHAG